MHLSFSGGSVGCTDVDVKTDASMGAGDITLALPSACTGTGVTMTAALYSNATSAPISPPVASSITADIN